MFEQSFFDIRVTLDHTEIKKKKKMEKCFFQAVLDSELHIYSPLLFLVPPPPPPLLSLSDQQCLPEEEPISLGVFVCTDLFTLLIYI